MVVLTAHMSADLKVLKMVVLMVDRMVAWSVE